MRASSHVIARRAVRATALATAVVSALPLTLTAYLVTLTIAGTPRGRRSGPPRPAEPRRVAILVPAHNEAAGIAATLRSMRTLDYPAERFSVHVVADNCTDDTAAIVRAHGWHAHERCAPDDPGKGPALNWLYARLDAADDPFDIAVIVDADSSLDREFLRRLDSGMGDALAAQAFYGVRDPGTSPATSFRYAALACRHLVRARGRTRLGASCGLYGNGMAFTREALRTHRWSAHLAEDAELQMELLLAGHKVAFVADAVLEAEMPAELADAGRQNARWERGRLELLRRYVPRLGRTAIKHRDRRVAAIDAILDHLTPPLSVLVTAHAALGTIGAALALGRGSRSGRWTARAHMVAVAAIVAHAVAGLAAVNAPRRHYRALLSAPPVIVWKVVVWARVLRPSSQVSWTRTRRNAEQGNPPGSGR